jgi:hypothetical protein
VSQFHSSILRRGTPFQSRICWIHSSTYISASTTSTGLSCTDRLLRGLLYRLCIFGIQSLAGLSCLFAQLHQGGRTILECCIPGRLHGIRLDGDGIIRSNLCDVLSCPSPHYMTCNFAWCVLLLYAFLTPTVDKNLICLLFLALCLFRAFHNCATVVLAIGRHWSPHGSRSRSTSKKSQEDPIDC